MNAARRYGNVQVETASRERLMVLLFETALKHIRAAAACLRDGRRSEGVKLCTKASAIVVELHATLDRERAPELCDTLASLYQFCCGRLLVAATSGKVEPILEAERVFAPLVDAFSGAVQKLGKAG